MSARSDGRSFETVVVPERQAQPRAWLSFKRASVYKRFGIPAIDCGRSSIGEPPDVGWLSP